MNDVTLRDATTSDVDFLAWVMLAASRSHLDRGVWEYLNDHTGEETLGFLKRIAVTDTVHLFHHSLFLIAEVDGAPAGFAFHPYENNSSIAPIPALIEWGQSSFSSKATVTRSRSSAITAS